MPRHTILSDGSRLEFPDGFSNDQMTSAYHAAEKALFDKYTAQATQQGGPVHTNSTIYSGSRAYPNNWHGNMMAWLDTHDYGDEINRSALGQKIINAVSPAVSTGARIATNALNLNPGIALADLGVGAYNVARGIAQRHNVPGASYLPSGATAPEIARSVFGTPELASDAGPLRRTLEDTSTMMLNPSQSLPSAVMRVGGSEVAGNVGGAVAGHYLGPDAGDIAQFGGSVAGAAPEAGGRAVTSVPKLFAHADAPEIYQSARSLGIEPSFMSLANVPSQRFARWLGAVPVAGNPIKSSNEAVTEAIQGVRDQAATDVASGFNNSYPYTTPRNPNANPLPPTGSTPESIGATLVRGAQQAVPWLQAYRKSLHQNVDDAMSGQTVDIAPVVGSVNTTLAGNRTTPANEALVRSKVADLASMAPGGANYDVSARGPVPPLPQPTMDVPWSAVKDFRTGLSYALDKTEPHVPDNLVDAMKDKTTAAMRDAADQAGQGQAFDLDNQVYASTKPTVRFFQNVSGRPIGDTGQFEGPMKENTAFNLIANNTQSPSVLEPFTNPRFYPPENWRSAAGGFISQLGAGDQGTFRPERFADQWSGISTPVQDQLTQTPTGGPSDAAANLTDAANVGRNVVIPVSRHGLTEAIGAGAVIEGLSGYAGDMLHHAGLGFTAPLATGATMYGISRGIESDPFKRLMASQPTTPWLDQLYQGVPAAALTVQGDQPQPGP